MEKLAILGGKKEINFKFQRFNHIGKEEIQAVNKVMESGILSQFVGASGKEFYGGPKVKEFEEDCKDYFGVKYAITVNSWTAGLITALGALELEPGDEVIVTPWTMCATATSILQWNAIPVFADIDRKTFNIDIHSVEKKITKYTKAIVAADIFGQSCNIDELLRISKKHNIRLLTDTAQAPGTFTKGRKTGTIADIGGFSLNYHKHIHTGEGGIIVTNSKELYQRCCLIRNHGEAAVEGLNINNICNIIGQNYRLGEIECSIGIEQLKKLDKLVLRRQKIAEKLNIGLRDLIGLTTPYVVPGNTHAYYCYPMILDCKMIGVPREILTKALTAEGLEGVCNGYVNVHMLPIFQKKIAYGKKGYPWSHLPSDRDINYSKGICPVAEELNDYSFMGFEMCLHELTDYEVDKMIAVFRKVWSSIDQLKINYDKGLLN